MSSFSEMLPCLLECICLFLVNWRNNETALYNGSQLGPTACWLSTGAVSTCNGLSKTGLRINLWVNHCILIWPTWLSRPRLLSALYGLYLVNSQIKNNLSFRLIIWGPSSVVKIFQSESNWNAKYTCYMQTDRCCCIADLCITLTFLFSISRRSKQVLSDGFY